MSTRVVNGETELPRLVAKLRAAGAVEVRREMNAALRAAVIPVVQQIQAEAAQDFPKGGGMNLWMAKRKPRRYVRTTGRNMWIRVQYTGGGRYGDKGPWKHPVFGRFMTPKPNEHWAQTSYEPTVDYYQRGGEKARPMATALMERVLIEIDRRVNGMGL